MKHFLFPALLVFAVLSGFSFPAQGQTIPSIGRDFYLAYPYPAYREVVAANSADLYRTSIFVTSYEAATVYVSYFDTLTGVEDPAISYYVAARTTKQIPLNVLRMKMREPSDRYAEFKSVHVYSKQPISVSFYSFGPCAGASYLALPVAMLGKKYVAASYNDNPDGIGGLLGGSGALSLGTAAGNFIVVGAHDQTIVQITPSTTTQGGHKGVSTGPGATGTPQPYSISLNKGQCYLVKSSCDGSDQDISGSIIESDKPIGVISGHENSWLGDVGAWPVEGRDQIVEQMIPVDYWDSEGYVSIPFVGSNADGVYAMGENYRVYTDEVHTAVKMQQSGSSSQIDLDAGRFSSAERFGVRDAVSFNSSDGHKFSVFQYDNAEQGANPPFPRPSMMTIVPISSWGRSYGWYVPTTGFGAVCQRGYVNIIAPKSTFDNILLSINGLKEKQISQSGLTTMGANNVPGHSELTGRRYRLSPGSYYVHSNTAFIAYVYGNDGVDFDGDLPDIEANSFFFSWANPCGYFAPAGGNANLKVEYDSSCSSWNIKLADLTAGSKIKSISIINDPNGEVFPSPYDSYNCNFDLSSDPLQLGEIVLPERDSLFNFTLSKSNPAEQTIAYIYVVTTSGWKILNFSSPRTVKEIGSKGILGLTSDVRGTVIDTTIVFVDTSSVDSYTVTDVGLAKADSNVKIVSTSAALPMQLHPGDSLKVRLKVTVIDTALANNYIYLNKDCTLATKEFSSKYLTGIIDASDQYYNTVEVGKGKCFSLFVRNIGDAPFTLTKNFTISDAAEFYVDPSSLAKLPHTIAPNDSLELTVCYQPKDTLSDTATITWNTTIAVPYTQSIKSYSVLYGNGSQQQSVVQDKTDVTFLSITPMPVRGDEARLHFTLAKPSRVTVTILDLLGREVAPARSGFFGDGEREVLLSVKGLSAGFYYARFETEFGAKMIKMQVVR